LSIKKNIGSIKLLWKFSFDDGSLKDSLFKYLESNETLTYIESLNNKYYSNNAVSSYIFIGSRDLLLIWLQSSLSMKINLKSR